MFRSSSLRLAALYTLGFALAVVALGTVTFLTTRAALTKQFDARIQVETRSLVDEYREGGWQGLAKAVEERNRTPGALDYGLRGPHDKRLAGFLQAKGQASGWAAIRLAEHGDDHEAFRVLITDLPGGYRLVVGDGEDEINALDGVILRSFAWALLGVIILGILGGYNLSRGVQRRLGAISGTAEAIIDGDLTRRVPLRGSRDDLDRLALTFNRMLDRIAVLVESLKQVSNDIAHDLRTPLTRLRQKLEVALDHAGNADPVLEAALIDLDAILETFAALLRIAQIEGGARRSAFRETDLARIASTVVEAFAPSAEDHRQSLVLIGDAPLLIDGDSELLTQMLANLVENALRHAGEGTAIEVQVMSKAAETVVIVKDNGPGVPTAEFERLFDRFYRLERSRSTPGSGLGLALVAAVAKLHDGNARLLDASPGLQVEITLPTRHGGAKAKIEDR